VQRLLEHPKELDRQVGEIESQIVAWHRANDDSRRLADMPGIGPITASAIVASIGDAKTFVGRWLPGSALFRSRTPLEVRRCCWEWASA